jgi:hypothetical protein
VSEAMVQLELRKESIDVGRVGLFSGLYAMVVDLEKTLVFGYTSKPSKTLQANTLWLKDSLTISPTQSS